MNAPLPQQQVDLSVTKNKVQLIDLICEELQNNLTMCPLTPAWSLQGDYPVPMEVRSDALVQRFDLKTTHEGTYVAIPLQVVALADMGCKTIKVMWRHICVRTTRPLLCRRKPFSVTDHGVDQPQSIIHWYRGNSGKARQHRSTIDCSICRSGCDTVGCYHGIGKTKIVKALSAGIELNHLGDPKASLDDVMKNVLSVHVMERSAIHPTQCLQSATKYGYHTLGERGPVSFRN